MKKWVSGIISLVVISCISFSCSQKKSLQELLQDERKAIDRFFKMNDLKILDDYPVDGVFKENQYFKTPEGLFFQVVDSGNGKRVQLLDDVTVRFEYFQYIKDVVHGDDTEQPPINLYEPFSFVYGIPQTYTAAYYQSQAWVIPLLFVGEGAVVNLIIPSSLGASSDREYISPVFFKNLRYTSFN